MRVSRSGYGLGVSIDKQRKTRQFRARLYHHGRINLGRFSSAHEARLAYDQAVRSLGGAGSHQTNYPAGQFEYFDPTVADKVHQHLEQIAHNDGGDEAAADGQGGDAAGVGGAAAAVEDAGHAAEDAEHEAGAALALYAAADMAPAAAAAAEALWPADGSMAMTQADPDSDTAAEAEQAAAPNTAGPASSEALEAPAPHAAAAQLQGVQHLMPPQPLAGPAGAAGFLLPRQPAAANWRLQDSGMQHLALAPGGGRYNHTRWAAAADPHGDEITPELAEMLVEFLAGDLPQAGLPGGPQQPAAAAAAAQQAHHAQQQQQQPEDPSDRSSSGSGRYHSSSPSAAEAGPSTPGMAGQQAARVVDIPYIRPTMSFKPAALSQLQTQQQQQPQSPMSAAGLVSCVDTTVAHLTQLYARLTAQPLQHAGHAAVTWLAGVRAQNTALLGVNGAAAAQVYCASMHVCASLVSIAADLHAGSAAVGSFSTSYLMVVLELLMQALLSLRALCADLPPGQHLGREAMQGWRAGLQAQARTRGGQAVAKVLAFL